MAVGTTVTAMVAQVENGVAMPMPQLLPMTQAVLAEQVETVQEMVVLERVALTVAAEAAGAQVLDSARTRAVQVVPEGRQVAEEEEAVAQVVPEAEAQEAQAQMAQLESIHGR